VAVILYTVPENIVKRSDPRSTDKGMLAMLADAVAGNTGLKAATAAHKTFIDTLNAQKLPFKILTQSEMLSNRAFVSLYKPVKAKPVEKKTVWLDF